MIFPLGFWDISLLLAVTAIILLITSEILSPRYGRLSVFISRKKLENVVIAVSSLFFVTVAIRVVITI